jgi:hypothetical protein
MPRCTKCFQPIIKGERYHVTRRGRHHQVCPTQWLVPLKLQITKPMAEMLERLTKTELYGTTIEDVAYRLLENGISDNFPWAPSIHNQPRRHRASIYGKR